ncbi:MAG: hypothetical protein PHU85_19910, partial [Phycisphaerae bacterium]|nr:hypothetical protein [Phycisphaerae bacterium]
GEKNDNYVQTTLITNSIIYGIIRQRARATIDRAIGSDPDLKKLIEAVRPIPPANAKQAAQPAKPAPAAEAGNLNDAKAAIARYAVANLKWDARDAALLAEYAGLDLGKQVVRAADASPFNDWGAGTEAARANLGPLGAIGEQKATQLFAQLAGKFDPKAGAAYESIFAAWGGDVKEQSIDLTSGKVRPREITVDRDKLSPGGFRWGDSVGNDPTVYTRVDYFDENAKISDAEKAACKTILKNLPVVFTFAPMNLVHYAVRFPAKSTRVLTVSYGQYMFSDTGAPASYQLAYVVHPASLWKDFGPINLNVNVPTGVPLRASADCKKAAGAANAAPPAGAAAVPMDGYRGELKQKTGELLVAIAAAEWDKLVREAPAPVPPAKVGKGKF